MLKMVSWGGAEKVNSGGDRNGSFSMLSFVMIRSEGLV